jgi:hypothetical protein
MLPTSASLGGGVLAIYEASNAFSVTGRALLASARISRRIPCRVEGVQGRAGKLAVGYPHLAAQIPLIFGNFKRCFA